MQQRYLAHVTIFRRGKKTYRQAEVLTRSSIEAGLSALNRFVKPGEQFKLNVKPMR